MNYSYEYPRPMVCVDCVVFSEDYKKILLIQRAQNPYQDMWALPGGFIEMDETLEQSMARELHEETGISVAVLNQYGAFGNPGRDPRGRAISIVFWTNVPENSSQICAGSDASGTQWFPLNNLPDLAFDHLIIIRTVEENLSTRILEKGRKSN